MTEHDWHLFDVEKGYEVLCRVESNGTFYDVRRMEDKTAVRTLTVEEFEQWREEGDNPRGLE